MRTTPPDDWPNRRDEWQRRLPRLRLDAEPIDVQLNRLRAATWALTAVALAIGLMIVALFAAFRAPSIGLAVAGLLLGPVVGSAWRHQHRTRRLADAFLRESEARSRTPEAPGSRP